MCKIDLKDAYFSVPLRKESRKLVRCQWEGSLYEFLCLYFRLVPALVPAFAKLSNVPISLLRCLMIRAIVFLDDLLIFGNTVEEILVARDSVIFLLQHLGFMINFRKCVLEPTQEIEFLGMIVKSKTIGSQEIKRIPQNGNYVSKYSRKFVRRWVSQR